MQNTTPIREDNSMKTFFLAVIILSQFQTGLVLAGETQGSIKESAGFGLGALAGGLIAGPPGAIAGAVAGTWFGNKKIKEDKELHTLKKQLQDKEIKISHLQKQSKLAQSRFDHDLKKIRLEHAIKSLDLISNGIAFNIHFRTDSAHMEYGLNKKINKLAQLLQHYPNIRILLEGYADQRGSTQYNHTLSKKRILSVKTALLNAGIPANRIDVHAYGETRSVSAIGDLEGYMFDRRVVILLTLDKQV